MFQLAVQQPNYNLLLTNRSKKEEELASLNVPFGHASSVCVGETVYVGGGNDVSCSLIYGYDAHENKWLLIPKANDLSAFGLCEMNNSLVAVGGWDAGSGASTNGMLAYSPDEEMKWRPLESFTTPRACPSVASNSNFIAVYGGLTNGKDKSSRINSLEIYNIQLKKWSTYDNLPFKNEGGFVSSVLTANNKLMIATGNMEYWTSLDQLMKDENDMQKSAMVVPGCQTPRSMGNLKSSSVPANLSCEPCKEQPGRRYTTSMSDHSRESEGATQLALSRPLSDPWKNVQLVPDATDTKHAPCVSFALFGEQIIALWNGTLYALNIHIDSWVKADRLSSGCHLRGCSAVELKTRAKLLLIGGIHIDEYACSEKSDKVFQISYLT